MSDSKLEYVEWSGKVEVTVGLEQKTKKDQMEIKLASSASEICEAELPCQPKLNVLTSNFKPPL